MNGWPLRARLCVRPEISPASNFLQTTKIIEIINRGKIQGDGRKFLNHFKSYFGSQISPQSLNEIHIYRLQPKSATKGDFFSYDCCLWLSVRVGACCPLTFDLAPSNNVNASLVPNLARQSYSRLNVLRLQFRSSVHFPWFLIAVACLTRPLT